MQIMYGTINFGALKQRKVDCVQVAPHELAYSKATRHDNVRKKMSPNSHKLDPGLQRMMRRRQGQNHWPSPSPSSLFPSVAATERVMSYLKDEHPGSQLEDAWLSCVAGKPGDILVHQPSASLWKVVGCAEYAFLGWSMDAASNSTFFMRPNRNLLQWKFITDLSHRLHVPTLPFLADDGSIQWKATGPALPLQIALAQGGHAWSVAQMKRLLKQFKIQVAAGLNKAGLQQCLVEHFLGNKDDQKKALDAFQAADANVMMDSDLEDLVSCLDEEDANQLDLKELKDKKRKKRYPKNLPWTARFQTGTKDRKARAEEKEEAGEAKERVEVEQDPGPECQRPLQRSRRRSTKRANPELQPMSGLHHLS
jgi:hypothetical protein